MREAVPHVLQRMNRDKLLPSIVRSISRLGAQSIIGTLLVLLGLAGWSGCKREASPVTILQPRNRNAADKSSRNISSATERLIAEPASA